MEYKIGAGIGKNENNSLIVSSKVGQNHTEDANTAYKFLSENLPHGTLENLARLFGHYPLAVVLTPKG